jgi:hypothetical protein
MKISKYNSFRNVLQAPGFLLRYLAAKYMAAVAYCGKFSIIFLLLMHSIILKYTIFY